MTAFFRRSLVSLLSAGVVFGGFAMGRRLGTTGTDAPASVPTLSGLLSANARADGLSETGVAANGDATVPPEDVYEAVLDHVRREYVEGYGDSRLTQGALARMFASFDDPRTNYLEPALRRARQSELQGKFHGIGAVLAITKTRQQDVDYHHLTIVDVMPGSPAQKAGLKSGDHITEIGGRWVIAYSIAVDYDRLLRSTDTDAERRADAARVSRKFLKGYTLSSALSTLTTGEDKPLSLTIARAGSTAPFKVDLTTGETEVEPVRFRALDNHIAYLRVRQFHPQAATVVGETLDKLDSATRGLVLDLRRNPGGVRADKTASNVDGYGSALKLVGRLTRSTTLGQIERRPGQREALTTPISGPTVSVPLVVLMDEGTAGIAEWVASALHDSGRAKLIGSRTFGDNVLPFFAVLKSGAGVEMASAHLLTAGGADWSRGLAPDIAAPNKGEEDAALQRALAVLGSSNH